MTLQPNTRKAILADGTEQDIRGAGTRGEITMSQIVAIIGDGVFTSFNLRDYSGHVVVCDDMGHPKGLPVNAKATALYHSICKPGTTHTIRGPVVICPDADFSSGDGL